MAVQQTMPTQPPAEETAIKHKDEAAKWLLFLSLIDLVFFMVVGLVVAVKFVFPGLFNGVDWLSWGRIRPAHVNGMIFGWLVPVFMSMACYAVPRLCGTPLYSEKLGKIVTVIWFCGVVVATFFMMDPTGTLSVWLMTKGKEMQDWDLPSNALIVVAWMMFCYDIFRTVANRRYRQMYVALWYILGTLTWTAFVYIIGNWPSQAVDFTFHKHWGFTGVNDANINWFYGHSIVGLVATPSALAICYYFLPKSINSPLYNHKLSIIGFWTLGAIYIWNGAHHMIYGPIPYWLQTVATIFSFLLFIPVSSAVTNFIGTMMGQWHQLRTNVPFKFLAAGVLNYIIVCIQGPTQALRPVSAVVHLTDYIIGHSHLALFGFVSMIAYGGLLYATPRMFRRPLYSEGIAEWSFWLSFLGLWIYVISMTISGIYQGLLWQNPHIPFIATVRLLDGFWEARAGGGLWMFLGAILVFFNVYKTATSKAPQPEEAPAAA